MRRESREEMEKEFQREKMSRKESGEEMRNQINAKKRNKSREEEEKEIRMEKMRRKESEEEERIKKDAKKRTMSREEEEKKIWMEKISQKESEEEARIQINAKKMRKSREDEETLMNKESRKETGEEKRANSNEKDREESKRRSLKSPKERRITQKRSREDDSAADENESKKHHADSPELPDPLAISNYQFHSELGEGTFGKVFLATLRNKKQNVAIKVIKKTSKISCVKIKTESNVLRIAKENPYLCQGFASFQSQSHSFLIMEFASGGSLWDQLAKYQRLEMSRVLDLKPENILLDQEGHVKIADFGLALETFGDRVTGYAGTLGYIAPEIIQNEEYDVAVDWWSFGIITCKMATGKSPFYDGPDREKVIIDTICNEPEIPDCLSTDLQHLLINLLVKDPQLRLGIYGDIRYHAFYSSIDWEELEQKKIPPPVQLTEVST
ncbi:hypothetical protein XELAEV_18005710mg [Xenopus laevis]|uniref:Protein kinase domain-containing protein n=1 Tax=Xenopus laevis TaxID=8355 RepID=A0A974DZ37_XENLA|nr:hypothetical protein XELAEV_18005710mg [Xenopus laevis]